MPLAKAEVKTAIIDELRTRFTFLATAETSEIEQLLGHKDIRPAYEEIKARIQGANSVPDQLRDSGITADMWAFASAARRDRGEARAEHAATTKRIADEAAQKVKLANAKLATRLAATDTPIVGIVEAGVDVLPPQVTLQLNRITDQKQRDAFSDAAMLEWRKARIAAVYGTAPFSKERERGTLSE
jgi:hypothetical protein